jgi:hypothetical protein
VASWLGNLFRGNSEPALSLGAFGKHPGWDDHIDDFGLDTEALLAARQLLYVQGVGGVIDSGAWDKLGPEEALPGFGHVCLWFSESDLLAARMWSSKDRKGRGRYPMVVCAHAANVDARLALGQILPALEAVEQSCRQAATADEIHTILESLRQSLRTRVASAAPAGQGANGAAASAGSVAAELRLSAESDAWRRILYAAETQLAAYGAGKIPEAAKRITVKLPALPALAQQMRLPASEPLLIDSTLFWRDLIARVLGTSAPLLFLQPLGYPWLDLIVGCPGPKQLLCLKASAKTIPLVQEVPYNLPEGFREKAARTFQDFCAPSR